MSILRRLLLALAPFAFASSAQAQALGSAPRLQVPQPQAATKAASPLPDRATVVAAYDGLYLPAGDIQPGWTGSVAGCVDGVVPSSAVGTLSPDFVQATLDRVNFYRLLAGLPDEVTDYTDTKPFQSRAAALTMHAQQKLSHEPPSDWTCSSPDGDIGAGNSNLALGYPGVAAIDGYMDDRGSGNHVVGHRRWILFPPQTRMAVGYAASNGFPAQALWVLGPWGVRPATPDGVAWPPRGFVPWQVLPSTSNRWSFSYPGANFFAARVDMTVNDVPLPPPLYEPVDDRYGDNTLVWRPSGVSYSAPAADTTYRVTLTGVGGSGVPRSFQYEVIVIDPGRSSLPSERVYRSSFETGERAALNAAR